MGNGWLRVWALDTGKPPAAVDGVDLDRRLQTIAVLTGGAAVVLAGSGLRDRVIVRDLAGGASRTLLDVEHGGDIAQPPGIAAVGDLIAVDRLGSPARLWSVATGREIPISARAEAWAIALSADGRWLAVGSNHGADGT